MTSKSATEWEYKALRDEILQNQRNCIQILAVSIAATGVILGFSVPSEKGYYLCLIPLIILVPALYLLISQVETTFRMGTYIRLFIEMEIEELQFETLLCEKRITSRRKMELYASDALGMFHGLGSICLILSSINWKGAITPLLAIVALFILHVVYSTIRMNRAVDPKRHEKFWNS